MERAPVVFLPIGATEAHGDHLPLSTDSLQPEAMAAKLAARMNGLIAPPIRYGFHSSTRNIPGTISVSFETLRGLMYDVITSLARNGVRRLVILSGHAGAIHMAALRLACEKAVAEFDIKLMLLTDYDIATELSAELGFGPDDGHGGLVETSRVLAIAPDLVKSKRSKGKFADKGFMIVSDPETCYPQGIAGDPTVATAETGERINEYIADRLCNLIARNFGEVE